jgi:hypothetical protein
MRAQGRREQVDVRHRRAAALPASTADPLLIRTLAANPGTRENPAGAV